MTTTRTPATTVQQALLTLTSNSNANTNPVLHRHRVYEQNPVKERKKTTTPHPFPAQKKEKGMKTGNRNPYQRTPPYPVQQPNCQIKTQKGRKQTRNTKLYSYINRDITAAKACLGFILNAFNKIFRTSQQWGHHSQWLNYDILLSRLPCGRSKNNNVNITRLLLTTFVYHSFLKRALA